MQGENIDLFKVDTLGEDPYLNIVSPEEGYFEFLPEDYEPPRWLSKLLFWTLHLEIDSEGNMTDREKGEDLASDKKEHSWKKITTQSTIDTMANSLRNHVRGGSNGGAYKKAFTATEEVADDRSRNEHDVQLAIFVDQKDKGFMVNISGNKSDNQHIGYKKEVDHGSYGSYTRVALDPKTIKSIMSLARRENFSLDFNTRSKFGITGDSPDKYEQLKYPDDL